MPVSAILEKLWKRFEFRPNDNQRDAILHEQGPLYLPAGPGSGKTRVLLWRTVNLVATHGVDPRQIYLSTFTEKAAHQLREGLRAYLGAVTEATGRPYDLSRMYVGTVHSLCQRILLDREFQPDRRRARAPVLLDDLDQFMLVSRRSLWKSLLDAAEVPDEGSSGWINSVFGRSGQSRFEACTSVISFFNRLSEECVDAETSSKSEDVARLLSMYRCYLKHLEEGRSPLTDFSLLQQAALRVLEQHDGATAVFKHVIVDEYQDTNTVQERIFFRLAAGHKNLCVVGDDDQALYRFRGATVENFVQFPVRCAQNLKLKPTTIPLDLNYRSSPPIVEFCGTFMDQCDWRRTGGRGSHRVEAKKLRSSRANFGPAVVASDPADPLTACAQIAEFVRELVDTKKVADPNQIAFLYPSLKSEQVGRMIRALETKGFRTYAPRARGFLRTPEATSTLGIFALIVSRPPRGPYRGDYGKYHDWLDEAIREAKTLVEKDRALARFVQERKADIVRARDDYARLLSLAERKKWELASPYDAAKMKRAIIDEAGLSEQARKKLLGKRFEWVVNARAKENNPVPLEYAFKRATSIDWSLLDLFYQLCLFQHWAEMFDAAQRREDPDEGPVANLGLLTGYIARFMEQRVAIITGDLLQEDKLTQMLFGSYAYALFRRGESEFEDADDPFPKGRIPFLTIHQSKGLEFPVVVLGNPRKDDSGAPEIEKLVRPLLSGAKDAEPLDRLGKFDIMRMYYVALSRAKNLLVVARYAGRGQRINSEFTQVLQGASAISAFALKSVPVAAEEMADIPSVYSYTGDYLAYQRCPRQYMIYRKFNFVPSRAQTMIFGTLVHRTLDDLHQHIIAARGA